MAMGKFTEEKVELKKWFHSAKSLDEMLKVFKKMESCFDEDELGLECFALTNRLFKDGFPEKVLLFGKRALNILLKNPSFGFDHTCEEHTSSLSVAFVLLLLGTACFDLEMFDESLRYLNWSNKNLCKIEMDGKSSCGGQCISQNLINVQIMLFRVKAILGKIEETVVHLRKILDIKEKVMEEGCIEIGQANKEVYEAYVLFGDSKEALPFGLKALEIYTKHFGRESMEVVKIMTCLAGIYYDLGEHDKAIELNTLSQFSLKTVPWSPDLLTVEIQNGELLIEMGRYEEAVTVFKSAVSHSPTEEGELAFAFVSMAKAFCELEKFAEARKYMKAARKIFERKKLLAIYVAIAFEDMSRIYEKMNDFETAMSMLRIAMTMPELHPKLLAQCATRFFALVSLTEKEKELIQYLEDVVEKLKKDFGPNHCEVGYSYARLGLAYMKLGQEELAVQLMANAKYIMDVSLGPHHLDSLKTSQKLSVTYGTIKRYQSAIPQQEEVIEGLKGLGSSEQEFMDEAVRQLNRLKEKVKESRTEASSKSKDSKDLCAKISKFGISDDGKVTK